MAKYSGKGWHFQSNRHSNARKYGRAGGKYRLSVQDKKLKKEFSELKKLHPNELRRTKLIITPKQKIRGYYEEKNDVIALPPNTSSDLLAHEVAHSLDYKDSPPTKHDKQFNDIKDKVEREIDEKIEEEIRKIETNARKRGSITDEEQNRIDELSDKKIIEHNKRHYGRIEGLQYIPVPKGLSNANNFPIQVRTIVPSTTKHNKPVSPERFEKRKKEMKDIFDKTFGADTAVEDVGSYWDGKEFITEKGAIVESSISKPNYNKNINKAIKIIKDKRRNWQQQTMIVGIEGREFLIPKQKGLDSDAEYEKKPIQINA